MEVVGAFSLNSNLDRAVSVVDPKITVLEMLLNTTHSITLHYRASESHGVLRYRENNEHQRRAQRKTIHVAYVHRCISIKIHAFRALVCIVFVMPCCHGLASDPRHVFDCDYIRRWK